MIGHLTERFSTASLLEDIQADKDDIHKFLKMRIRENREHIDEDFEAEIISKIGRAQGM